MSKPTDFYTQLMEFTNVYGVKLIVFSLMVGGVVGWISHYFMNVRPMRKALKREQEIAEKEASERKEKSRIRTGDELKDSLFNDEGKINTSNIRTRNRVAFNPEVEERFDGGQCSKETNGHRTENSDSEVSDEEEEQMPQINNRKVMSSSTRKVSISADEDRPLDSDRISQTLGRLHGKLATAQLKAKTRRIEAEMTAAEREQERIAKAQQMESIMNLMMENKEMFGMDNEEDIKEQLNLYNF
ncbi:unnamed protein product [Caenorhabditis bovis]|uniref:Matrix-remodeling-associated protein 7 helical domain-containing protein n=1 Tax=Caenorhabditis bovis TaxID=2654633 RepID=A0A8S1EF16_9PELO|nr:unnamed protein product [Caenorhabditis bovis]